MDAGKELTPAAPVVQKAPAPEARSTGGEATASRAQSGEFVQFAHQQVLQLMAHTGMASGGSVQDVAAQGVQGAGTKLPHLDAIQASFGDHDISGAQAHTDSAASQANEALGAEGFATGNHVAFASPSPTLHTAAHEAAHVVQQRGGVQLKGGVGEVGDAYEQHADAVADRVVQGKSATDLLDDVAPAGARGGSGGVQARAIQFDIKSDLRDAMSGWGTDEDAIFNRLRRATAAELQTVVSDTRLMAELRDDLTQGEMRQVLDLLQAPLPMKLRLAMQGWGTDEEYIHQALATATQAQLQAVAADARLVAQLQSELSGDDIRSVLDRLNLPLAGKLRYAVAGWGTDEAYIFSSITSAPLAEIQAVAADTALVAAVDSDLSGADLNRWRGMMAQRLWLEANDGLNAYLMIDSDNLNHRTVRLGYVGALEVQQALLDVEIANDNSSARVIHAFQSYWLVEIGVRDGATMAQWPVPVLRQMHIQLKALPSQDTRSGFWNRMTLSDASLIDPTSGQDVGLRNRAAWGDGNFIVGTQAGTGSTSPYGYGTTLTAAAASGATTLTVQEGDRLAVNDVIKITDGTNTDSALTIKAISGGTWTIDPALTHGFATGDQVTPDDNTAQREVSWLDATVRHEIAHGIDENMGVTGFTQDIGGWWTGTSFDDWVGAMANPWTTTAATPLTEAEKGQIKSAIVDAVTNQKGSLYGAGMALAAEHPVVKYQANNIPVIQAAEACLSQGDGFFRVPHTFHRSNGKAFTVSFWYKKFMYFNEAIIGQRVKDYGLYAPTEFFAEAYTVYYEEAGKPGVTEADYGRLIRNGTWRDWIKTNIHERNQGPAGTGASGEAPGASARPGSRGKHGGDPGP